MVDAAGSSVVESEISVAEKILLKKSIALSSIALLLLLPQLLGCSSSPGTAKKEKSTLTEVVPVTVYYVRMFNKDEGELIAEDHVLPKSSNMPKAALQELITGKPRMKDAFRVLPKNTKVLGVTIKDGVATVDFSKEVLDARSISKRAESMGIASVVGTLTQFSEIKQVRILVEGRDKGKIGDKNIEDWWGYGGIQKQPFSF